MQSLSADLLGHRWHRPGGALAGNLFERMEGTKSQRSQDSGAYGTFNLLESVNVLRGNQKNTYAIQNDSMSPLFLDLPDAKQDQALHQGRRILDRRRYDG